MAAPGITNSWKNYLPKLPQQPKPIGGGLPGFMPSIPDVSAIAKKAADDAQKAAGAANAAASGTIGSTTDASAASPAFMREQDFNSGMKQFQNFFGWNDPMMAEILKQRRERAMGLNDAEVQRMRERGSMGINQQMGTGLRSLSSSLASRGVRGGAAAGAAIPILTQANQQRAQLENDISLADMQRRGAELGAYESTLTGERSGLLGAALGNVMLGASDRNNADTLGLSKGFLDYMKKALDEAKNQPPVPLAPIPGGGPLGNASIPGWDPNKLGWFEALAPLINFTAGLPIATATGLEKAARDPGVLDPTTGAYDPTQWKWG